MVVEFNAEHHITNLHDVDLTQQHPTRIQHRDDGRMTAADLMHNLSQFHVGSHTEVILLDDRVKIHQRQYGVVGMMRQQLALFGES